METYKNDNPKGTVAVKLTINNKIYTVIFQKEAIKLQQETSQGWIKYKITKNKCNCPAAYKYFGPCKHVKCLHKVVEELQKCLQA